MSLEVLHGRDEAGRKGRIADQQAPQLSHAARDDRRGAILAAAEAIFLEEGYSAASMAAIAARVGGSKSTLYSYFRCKYDLFEAVVRRRSQAQLEHVFGRMEPGQPIARLLTEAGRAYVAAVSSRGFLQALRMVTAEAERHPEIGRLFYDNGPRQWTEALAEALQTHSAAPPLGAEEARRTAELFLSLCCSRFMFGRLCNATPAPEPEAIDQAVGDARRIVAAHWPTEAA